jgi:hypothetical protein
MAVKAMHKFFQYHDDIAIKELDEYIVKKYPAPLEAKIFLDGQEIAQIRKGNDLNFKLKREQDGKEWVLVNRVHGEPRPFSLSVTDASNKAEPHEHKHHPHHQYHELDRLHHAHDVLTIKNHIFKHGGRFYMLTNNPAGKAPQSYISGPRYISRLENFPHSELAEVEKHDSHGGSHKVKRFRGVPVGEASGLGISETGHHVKVGEELRDIGLFIAASSYLMYASA